MWTEQTVYRMSPEITPKPGESFPPFDFLVGPVEDKWAIETVAPGALRTARLEGMDLMRLTEFAKFEFVLWGSAEAAMKYAEELVQRMNQAD